MHNYHHRLKQIHRHSGRTLLLFKGPTLTARKANRGDDHKEKKGKERKRGR